MSPPRKKPPARPRVPLPRQTGGVHEERRLRPPRKAKHKRKPQGDE